MQRVALSPESKDHWLHLRLNDITSTEVAALFGLSPHFTLFELWHSKKNEQIIHVESNERMDWGNALEEAIATEACRVNFWDKPTKVKAYARIVDLRIGSSFDFVTYIGPEKVLLEVKNVDSFIFKSEWKEKADGGYEAPARIELQAQHQLLCSGLKEVYICVLVGGNKLYVLRRERNEKVINEILKEIAKFWQSIADSNPPKPDYVKDADYLIKMYSTAIEESVWEGAESLNDLATKYSEIGAEISNLEASKKATKAQILEAIGDYEKVKSSVFTISAGMVEKSENRSGYRNFRVYMKKK